MAKLTREQKIEINHKRKSGVSISSLSKQYGVRNHNIRYLIRLIDKHGEDVLRKDMNNYYDPEQKVEIINKVLVNKQYVKSTAIEYGLSSSGMPTNWIKSYKENGYTILEKKRGRISTMKKVTKLIDTNDKDVIIKAKDEKILRLKAENEYLIKLRAVVQARKNQ